MSAISPEIDSLILLFSIILLCAFLWLLKRNKNFAKPSIKVSSIEDFKHASSWKSTAANWPLYLSYGALALFVLAWIDPHLQVSKKVSTLTEFPDRGIAMYLVLDQSGSMSEASSVVSGGSKGIPKIDMLKQITKDFVEGDQTSNLPGRPNDLIGLVSFARTARVLVPLTLDHAQIIQELNKIQVVPNKDQDGTAIGYAIYKTVNVIDATRHYAEDLGGSDRPAYDIRSNVIILVTDGFQEANPADKGNRLRNIEMIEAAQFAKEKKVRLYIVNVEPGFNSKALTPHRNLMNRVAEETGGKFYLVNTSQNLKDIYADIDKLEKSFLPVASSVDIPKDEQPNRYQRLSLYPYLIALGLISLLFSILLNSSLLRQVP